MAVIENGYVKLHRSMLKWEWYDDLITKSLFIHLLLTVNIKDDKWHGIKIPRGSRVASIQKLSDELGFTNRQIRTGLAHLEKTGSVTRTKYHKCTVISVCCWSKYQEDRQANRQEERQATCQASDKQATSKRQQNKKAKKEKKETRDYSADAFAQAQTHHAPSQAEVSEACFLNGYDVDPIAFWNYNEAREWTANGQPIADWKSLLASWNAKERKKPIQKLDEDVETDEFGKPIKGRYDW